MYHNPSFLIPLALDIGRGRGKRDPDDEGMDFIIRVLP
jgi:hypothetical protein